MLALKGIGLKCQDEFKRGHLAEGPDQGVAWDKAEAEAPVVGPARAETVFVRTVRKGLRIRQEFRALSRNARSAERSWHVRNYGSS
jgi:hypothetical protein